MRELLNKISLFINSLIATGGTLAIIEQMVSKKNEAVELPSENDVQGAQDCDSLPDDPDRIDWIRKPAKTLKSTVVPCIVIDRNDHWHIKAKVDLKGQDTTDYSWQYYGFSYPVLIEGEDGVLSPFIMPEAAGENCNRLYKVSQSSGFRATFKHKSNLMSKLQTGLMVAIIIVLLVMIIVLLDWK